MTLALYGKSRRRQGGLLLAALVAVLLAMAAGVAGMQKAFAHHSTHQIVATCEEGSWTYTADFFGGGESGTARRVKIYKNDVLVKQQDFDGKSDVNDFYTETGAFGPGTNVTFRIEMFSGSGFNTNKDNEEPNDVKIQGAGPCDTINISNGECAENGFEFHFLIPNGVPNGQGGDLYITYKYGANGAPQVFGPVAEASDSSSPADWRPIIPFNGNPSITILGIYSTSGAVWVGNGSDKATVDASDCVPPSAPKLTVIKRVVDHNGNDIEDPKDFTFNTDRIDESDTQVPNDGVILDDDSDPTRSNTQVYTLPLTNGSSDWYEIKEVNFSDSGWQLQSITCEGALATSSTGVDDGDIEVKVENGSDVTCTFKNKKLPPPDRTFQVCKQLDVHSNGVNNGGNFTITISGQSNFVASVDESSDREDCTTTYTVPQGTKVTINETGFPAQSAAWPGNAAGYPKYNTNGGSFASLPSGGITVTVGNDSCEPVSAAQQELLADTQGQFQADIQQTSSGPDCLIIIKNKAGDAPPPSVSVSKADSGDGTYDLGTSFYWTLTFSVTNPPTTSDFVYTDNVPAQFTVTSLSNEVDPDGELSCSNVGNAVTCTLDDGAGTATNPTVYSIRVNVTVKNDATCGFVTNTVMDATGKTVASDEVKVEGCGNVTVQKADSQVVVNDAVIWTITLSNDSAISKNVIVYDPDTDLVAAGTVGCVANAQNDYYDCTVPPGSNTATLKLSQAIPAHDTCLPYELTNTAYIAASNTAGSSGNLGSDSGKYTEEATASADCITVTKTNTGNGTWNITFSNTGPQATVEMSDTYEPNGTNTNINSVGAPATGCSAFHALSVTGCDVVVPTGTNSVTIAVETDPLGNKCEDQRVVNTVTATYNGVPVKGSGANDDFSLEGTESLCTRQITITKNFENLGGYVPVASDVPGFTLDPSAGTSCDAPVKVNDSQWTVTCTVPAEWDGTVTETLPLPNGWRQCLESQEFALVRQIEGFVRSISQVVIELPSSFAFCNEPFGTIRIEKVDGVNGDGSVVLWDFTVGGNFSAPGGGAYANPAQASDATPFVSLPIGLSNTPVTVAEVLARSITLCTGSNQYYTIATPPADTAINTPGEVQTWTFQNIPCGTLGTGGVIIEKYEDINGNGIVDAGDDPISSWTFTTTGGGIPALKQVHLTDANGQILEYIQGFDAGTVLTVTETQQAGWSLTGVYLDGANIGTNLSNGVVIIGGETRVIRYLNQQLGSINIHKDAVTRHNLGPDVPAPQDDDGWTFTLVSAACKINFVGQTDASGNLSFTGLPMCSDYVVTEVGPNPSSPGFVQVSPAGAYTGQTPNGQTLNFLNRKTTNDPPCLDCRQQTPTATPTTPTATPTTPTATPTPVTPTVPPTNTPTNTPVTNVAGDKTPGPGQPTPIAPSTGGGLMDGTASGLNILLVLAGLLALTGGLGALALGRRSGR